LGDVVEYELLIYNRWGNLLFVSKEVQRGWDGYYNGKLCSMDVYVWRIRCKFTSGEIVIKTGDVTLLR
jgi:gliding motility-associated-like protein